MRSRKAKVAMLLSAVFPGLGQFYNHEYAKGTAFLLSGLVLGWMSSETFPLDTLLAGKTPEGLGQLITVMSLFLVCYLYSMVDAYRLAKRAEQTGLF